MNLFGRKLGKPVKPGLRILIADDVELVRALFYDTVVPLFESHDVDLVEAGDTEEFRAALEERMDLIICDHHFGRADGIALLREAHAAQPAAPLVLISAYEDFHALRSGLSEGGVDAIVRKPWDLPLFSRLLKRLLQRTPEERARDRANGSVLQADSDSRRT